MITRGEAAEDLPELALAVLDPVRGIVGEHEPVPPRPCDRRQALRGDDVADVPDTAADLRAGQAGGGHELIGVQAGEGVLPSGRRGPFRPE